MYLQRLLHNEGLCQEAATDTAEAQATPSDVTTASEGDGGAPCWIEGEEGADLHGSASCNGCARHTAGLAQERQAHAVDKFAQYLQCMR